jgi:hypothetical protein
MLEARCSEYIYISLRLEHRYILIIIGHRRRSVAAVVDVEEEIDGYLVPINLKEGYY